MAGKIIKGQAWITGDRLLQDQILLLPGGISSNNTIALIEDIWKDLTSDNGTYKYNGKNYFYWIYKMTDPEDDSNEIEVMLECPRPKDGLFGEGPFDDKLRDAKGEWAKYWLKKYKDAYDRSVAGMTIQPKEILFPGTEYVAGTGDLIKLEENRVQRDDLDDLENLLSIM